MFPPLQIPMRTIRQITHRRPDGSMGTRFLRRAVTGPEFGEMDQSSSTEARAIARALVAVMLSAVALHGCGNPGSCSSPPTFLGGDGTACEVGNHLLACTLTDGNEEDCVSNDATMCSPSASTASPTSCADQCKNGEFGVACTSLPRSCRLIFFAPLSRQFGCCPC